MKRFYLHNGTEQQGPFDIEDLKTKNISRETSIWYEGLDEWTTAEKVEDLKSLFKSTPPPLRATKLVPPPLQKTHTKVTSEAAKKKKNTLGKILQSIGIIGAIVLIIFFVTGYFSTDHGISIDTQTYQEKVMTVEEIESSKPTNFLTASGNYTENFWGTKIKVNGVITNTATVATYKDAVVRIRYYSKTKTELGSEKYTIYETLPPNSTTPFELKIENYKNVNSIDWKVESATAN
jgi:hypothetical protein